MAEKKESPLFGCLAIFALVALVGSCMAGGSEDPEPESSTASPVQVLPEFDAQALKDMGVDLDDLSPGNGPIGATMLEQAIIDAFITTEGGQKTTNARDFVGAAINSQGHLCAGAVEAQKAASDMYGVGCVTNSNGGGRSNYLVNTRTGSVTPI